MKNIYILSNTDIKKLKQLTRILEKALVELIELRRVTNFDDNVRNYYPPAESDLIEERSFLEYQLNLIPPEQNEF